jgi:small-conductance mechanosensitive channel
VRKTDLFTAWDQVNQAPKMIVRKWQQEMSNAQTLRSVTYILIFLFVGAGLEWLYGQYAGQHLLKLELQKPQSLKRRIHTAFFRALLTFAGLCCFALGSIGVFLSFNWTPLVENLVMEILIVIITVRIGITVTRFFLAPRLKELRLVPLSNVQAKSVYFWSSILIFLCALNIAVANVFEKLLDGLQNQVLSHSTLSINLISNFVLLVVALFSLYRGYQVFRASESPSETMANKPLVYQFWTGYLSVLLIVSYILWMLDISLIMQTLFILGLLVPLMRLFRTWIDYLFDQAEYKKVTEDKLSVGAHAADQTSEEIEDSAAEEINQHPYDNYRPIARRLLRFALVVIAFLALMMVWGYNPFSLSNVDSFSGKLFGISLDVVAVVMIGDLVWIWAKTVIDKRLTDYRPPEDGHAPGPEARMATLLPLLRTMLIVTLFSVVVFSVLASLGFNIGPLLAGAGVIGLAIGFGAQTLVKDVVSGIFYLIDDAFRVGEYIEIGNLRGTVESMSIRSLRIRHHRGAVHTVPFGELNSITNHSRDWVIMKLEFRVPFDTDMKQVKKLVKKIGKKLLENADFGHSFIEPLKSQGVRRMEEFNMVLGVKFMTRPGEQWVIRREAYHQIRDTFEANGINLAERNVKVQVLNADKLDEETKQAAIGAAQHATEQPLPAGPIPDEP